MNVAVYAFKPRDLVGVLAELWCPLKFAGTKTTKKLQLPVRFLDIILTIYRLYSPVPTLPSDNMYEEMVVLLS